MQKLISMGYLFVGASIAWNEEDRDTQKLDELKHSASITRKRKNKACFHSLKSLPVTFPNIYCRTNNTSNVP
jgi:hypothetical protein